MKKEQHPIYWIKPSPNQKIETKLIYIFTSNPAIPVLTEEQFN